MVEPSTPNSSLLAGLLARVDLATLFFKADVYCYGGWKLIPARAFLRAGPFDWGRITVDGCHCDSAAALCFGSYYGYWASGMLIAIGLRPGSFS